MNKTFRALGAGGAQVSRLGVGCNAFGVRADAEDVQQIVDTAFELGVNFFDTADIYGFGQSETLLGRALAGRREHVVLATKFGLDMEGRNGEDHGRRGTRDYIRRAVEASLERLGTDWIDLYQFHAPDRQTPVSETLEALHELVEEGTVKAIGCSNFLAWELVDAHWIAETNGWTHFSTAQNEYSLYNPAAEAELVPASMEFGIGVLPYIPLAWGLLTGKYSKDKEPSAGTRLSVQRPRWENADWDRIAQIEAFANERGLDMLAVALGGLASRPAVSSVIAGVTSAEQLRANAEAISWEPNEDDRNALDELCRPRFQIASYAPEWNWQRK